MEAMQEKIDGWKKEYDRVFQCKISGNAYVYRTLKRGEFRSLQEKMAADGAVNQQVLKPSDAAKMEDNMVKLCLLSPENVDIDKLPAGVPAVLAAYVSDASGFSVDAEPVLL